MNYLRVSDIINALNGDESAKTKVYEAIDHEEWHSSEVVLRTPGQLLITPTEIDTFSGPYWSSLQKAEY